MLDDFDPNVPCENYKERLKQYYEDIKTRMDKKGLPVITPPVVKKQ
jgi:hypothetical protein